MKPAPFQYAAPESVEDAVALLHEYGPDAKLLAGGQSLVPLLNMRLARPSVIIDLNRIRELDYIREDDGEIVIGAMTRQRTAERSPVVSRHLPLLAEALPMVGHMQIRSRGTIGGSIAHADPAAELPAVLTTLEGSVVIQSSRRTHRVTAQEFFRSYLTTALEPDDVLVEVRLPTHAGHGTAFLEVARRHGDYALVGVAVEVRMTEDRCTQARLAFTGVGPVPVRIPEAEAALEDTALTDSVLTEVANIVRSRITPESDIHASAEYRREVAGILAHRALRAAGTRVRRPKGTRDRIS